MKKIISLITVCFLITSCAPGPVGVWNYSVTGTPQGDYAGIMTINKAGQGYTAMMTVLKNETPFNKFTYTKKSKKADGDFDFSGVNILFSAQLNKELLKGTMSTSGLEFPFTATRKK